MKYDRTSSRTTEFMNERLSSPIAVGDEVFIEGVGKGVAADAKPVYTGKEHGTLKDHENILFYSPVWWFPKPLPPRAYEWAFWLKEQSYEYRVQKSNRGGFQSPGFSWAEFQFRDHIQSILYEFEEFKDFEFTNWWLNINEKGNYNGKHVHPLADLSGVWYITDNEGSINFEDPQIMTRSNVNRKLLGTNLSFNMQCLAGDLIIFPSDMQHSVEPHTLDTPRISVSFNMQCKS